MKTLRETIAEAKAEHRKSVAGMLHRVPLISYPAIAEMAGVSYSYVLEVAKAEGIRRWPGRPSQYVKKIVG